MLPLVRMSETALHLRRERWRIKHSTANWLFYDCATAITRACWDPLHL